MELGIFTFVDNTPDPTTGQILSGTRRLQNLIEELRLSDEIGLDVFGVGEHHREEYLASAPPVVLAAAASITKNIKLTSAVTVLGSEDPVRVYQQFSTLDLLSAGRAEIMDAAHPGGLGGTFGGNPVSSAAVVAVFEEVAKRNLLGEAKRVEKTLKPALLALQKKHSVIADVRGVGAMLAIELVDPTTKKPEPEVAKAVQTYGLHHGVLILTAGTFGNVLRFLPPVVITDEQLLDAVAVMDEALSAA
jgi:hypothetical protein